MNPPNRDRFTPSDAAAREAARDPRRQVLLRASAGTGKTTVLTERYLELLKCGVSPRNILALTFTRKAAAEMKDRILGLLAEPGLRQELAKRRDREERNDLAEVQVSTIDAFNLGLVREFPLDAGVRPGVEILDERSMPIVRNEALERVFSGAGKMDGEALAALPLLVGRTRGSLRQAAANYLDNRLTWSRRFEEKAEELESGPAVAEAPPQLGEALREARPAGRRLLDADRSARFLSLPARLALSAALGEAPAAGTEERARARHALDRETLERFFRFDLKTPAKGLPKERREDWNEVEQALREHRTRWLAWRNDRAFRPMWNLFRAVAEEYRLLKEERGVMDFDDLTIAVTAMFRNLDEFSRSRFRLEARYHHLLLDEFQDTSDAQWELLQALMLPWTHGEGLAAEEVRRATNGRIERPTLFIVGDHKQSIYRFRNARVEILGQAEEWIDRELAGPASLPPSRLDLKWNFRSVWRLRRFFNRASGAIAAESEAAEGTDWAFRYDDTGDRLPEDEGPKDRASDPTLPVAVCVAPFERGAAQDAHAAAARRIAARIREVIARGAAPEEVAILARAGANLGIYREAVERAGIPTYLVKGWDFFSTSEVRDLTALCRFLARPHSDRRAVELLRSRFFALPGELLARLKQASARPKREGPPGTPFADLLRSGGRSLPAGLDESEAASLRDAGAAAGEFCALARELPPSTAVAGILRQTRYVERARRAAKYPHAGDQQAANLKKAIQHLRAVERGGFATMERAARALEAADAGDATQAPVRAAGAVQALTVHAAKGLEFDHVFLVDCGRRTGSDRGIPRVQETGEGWKIALLKDAPFWDAQDGGRADSEERRCMYVALTRARRTLTLSWIVSFNKKDGRPSRNTLPRFLPAGLVTIASETARPPADRGADRPATIEWKEPGRNGRTEETTAKDGQTEEGSLPLSLEVLPEAIPEGPPRPNRDPATVRSAGA